MARPRAASDEQIIETAEKLAETKGWRAVYARAVHEELGVGGSLSTFTTVVNRWRAEKESVVDDVNESPEGELVEDRKSVIDEGLASVAGVLKTMRDAVMVEIDRAVSDERKKSDRVRADERELHETKMKEMHAGIAELTSENDGLATEAQEESARADTAEEEIGRLTKIAATSELEIASLKSQVKELSGSENSLKEQVTELHGQIDDVKAEAKTTVEKAERREREVDGLYKRSLEEAANLRLELKDVNAEAQTKERENLALQKDLDAAKVGTARTEKDLMAARATIETGQAAIAEATAKNRPRACACQ